MTARETKKKDGDETTRVVHEVDGIQELDNRLPLWWLWSLYGTIVFGALYWIVYEVSHFAPEPGEIYAAEVEKARADEAERIKKSGAVTGEGLVALSKDPATLATGKDVFVKTCVPCHRDDGGGTVGPNLTDAFWIHGGTPEKIYATVKDGVLDKGMPAWGAQLGPERVQAVVAYVLTLTNTNVPGGKAPQGERVELTMQAGH